MSRSNFMQAIARCARAALAPALIVLATLSYAPDASACSCVPPPPPAEALAKSGSVLEGRVTSLKREPAVHRITATLDVRRRWKGAGASVVTVVTIDAGSMCGFTFERGKTYLLYTGESEGVLSVSLCSRSRESAGAAEEIAELDRAAKSAPPAPSSPAAPPVGVPTADAAVAPSAVPDGSTDASTDASVATSRESGPQVSPSTRSGGCAGCVVSAAAPPSIEVGLLLAAWLLVALGARRKRRAGTTLPARGSSGACGASARRSRSVS